MNSEVFEQKEISFSRLYWYLGWWYDFTKIGATLFISGLLIYSFVLAPGVIDGESLLPSYENHSLIMIDLVTYKTRLPKRGEVIAFYFPGNPTQKLAKRIIGLPGDEVVIQNGTVYINRQRLGEAYLIPEMRTYPNIIYTVAPGEYYVLGDARTNSLDSRMWGAVPQPYILGRVLPWTTLIPSKSDFHLI